MRLAGGVNEFLDRDAVVIVSREGTNDQPPFALGRVGAVFLAEVYGVGRNAVDVLWTHDADLKTGAGDPTSEVLDRDAENGVHDAQGDSVIISWWGVEHQRVVFEQHAPADEMLRKLRLGLDETARDAMEVLIAQRLHGVLVRTQCPLPRLPQCSVEPPFRRCVAGLLRGLERTSFVLERLAVRK